jgi:hypothetical protein
MGAAGARSKVTEAGDEPAAGESERCGAFNKFPQICQNKHNILQASYLLCGKSTDRLLILPEEKKASNKRGNAALRITTLSFPFSLSFAQDFPSIFPFFTETNGKMELMWPICTICMALC